jgi:hypothetical protein
MFFRAVRTIALMMEAAGSSGTSVNFYQIDARTYKTVIFMLTAVSTFCFNCTIFIVISLVINPLKDTLTKILKLMPISRIDLTS